VSAIRSPWLAAFAAVSVGHLVLITADVSPWDTVTKVMLMPLLAIWAYTQGAPRLLIAALLLSTVGDFAMDFESLFLLGMAGFALAHVCYISFFVSRGALDELRKEPWIGVVYAVAAAMLVVYLWNQPSIADLRIPIPFYAALLATTAATSLALDTRAGIGAAMFMASDALIALGVAELPQPKPADLWIMVLYILGQLLLTTGILNKERTSLAAMAQVGPNGELVAQRTDCWPRLP